MEEKHPLREVDTCWFSPDNPEYDPRWNKPSSEYYEKAVIGLWVGLFGDSVLLVCCCALFGVLFRKVCWGKVELGCMVGLSSLCGSCQCQTNNLFDCFWKLWNRCCGGWQRFEDEEVGPEFPL